MKAKISVTLETKNNEEAQRVKKAFETMERNFGAAGIIKMEHLFLNDAFIRNLVRMKITKG